MDALYYSENYDQYTQNCINREITKCYAAFSSLPVENDSIDTSRLPIATGHWGCGAFRGDKQIKCKIIG